MRILHVIRNTDRESGGPLEALLRFSEVMVEEGHIVEVVSLESEEAAAQNAFPFQVTALGPGIGRYGYNFRLVPWLHDNATRFDAVILHGLWNYTSLGSWRALKSLSVPYFVFAHGMMDPWFREAYPIKHLAKQVFWSFGEGKVLRDAKLVLFTCEEEKIRSRNAFRGQSYKERVILFGTSDPAGDEAADRAAFKAAFPELTGRRILLFLSRIHTKKGCDLLIQAFSDNVAQLPPDVDLVMAGPDQIGLMRDLKGLAERLGVAHRVHWPGMLTGELKWGAFRSAEALILPSHQENFGIVVAEAMACSTPVLISDKVNIWREVNQSQSGLVEPDSIEGTRNLIRRFFAMSAKDRTRMGIAARKGFARYFDIKAAARDLIEAIELA